MYALIVEIRLIFVNIENESKVLPQKEEHLNHPIDRTTCYLCLKCNSKPKYYVNRKYTSWCHITV